MKSFLLLEILLKFLNIIILELRVNLLFLKRLGSDCLINNIDFKKLFLFVLFNFVNKLIFFKLNC